MTESVYFCSKSTVKITVDFCMSNARAIPRNRQNDTNSPGSASVLRSNHYGISLVVQWLKLPAPNAWGLGSTSGQGSRSHVMQ